MTVSFMAALGRGGGRGGAGGCPMGPSGGVVHAVQCGEMMGNARMRPSFG